MHTPYNSLRELSTSRLTFLDEMPSLHIRQREYDDGGGAIVAPISASARARNRY
jgi:hypothetical protein